MKSELSRLNEHTIESVVRLCQQGDSDGYRAIYEAFKGRMYNLARRMTGEDAMAEELTQQIFVEAFASVGSFDFRSEFSTWLYGLALNVIRDARRRSARRRETSLSSDEVRDLVSEASSPEAEAEARELTEKVRRTLLALPPKVREVLVLRVYEELSYEEIAHILSCSEGTVASRLSRGRELLARRLRGILVEGAE